MAPCPMSSRKICELCAGVARTVRDQPLEPRRAITARRTSPSPSSKPITAAAPRAACTRSARASECGEPERSSSPVRTTVIDSRSSSRASARARTASSWMTSPPFMSMMPGPRAVESVSCSQPRTPLAGSNTVSRCPTSTTRGAPLCPARSAIRWPARPHAAPSTQRVRKPSASHSGRSRSATARTPAKFIVPLFCSTSRRSSAVAFAQWRSTDSTARDSAAESPALAGVNHPASIRAANEQPIRRRDTRNIRRPA